MVCHFIWEKMHHLYAWKLSLITWYFGNLLNQGVAQFSCSSNLYLLHHLYLPSSKPKLCRPNAYVRFHPSLGLHSLLISWPFLRIDRTHSLDCLNNEANIIHLNHIVKFDFLLQNAIKSLALLIHLYTSITYNMR